MGVATSLSSERMTEIEQSSVTGGSINSEGHLILTTKAGATIDAGQARGADGSVGEPGPPGPPAEDTGFVTNLTLGTSIYWQLNGYTARKAGGLAVVNVSLTYLAPNPDIVADASGNIADIAGWIQLPIGWQNSSGMSVMCSAVKSGYATWWCRVSSTGANVDLTHASYPGQKLVAGDTLYANLVYWCS